MELNKIYCMDNIHGMKQLDNETIDLVVTSPPYDNLRNYKGFSFDVCGMASELWRIMKDGGVIVWIVSDATVNGTETCTSFKQALTFREHGFNLHDTMIWIKDGGGAIGSNLCYTQNFEYMFVFSKGKPKTVNLIYDKLCKTYDGKEHYRKESRGGYDKGDRGYTLMKRNEYSRRNNWWYYVPQSQDLSGQHPAVFPEIIVRDHILSWSNDGDVVLDPFMGSGTTAKVARALGRKYIGFDISQEYVDLANKRMSDTKTLFDL